MAISSDGHHRQNQNQANRPSPHHLTPIHPPNQPSIYPTYKPTRTMALASQPNFNQSTQWRSRRPTDLMPLLQTPTCSQGKHYSRYPTKKETGDQLHQHKQQLNPATQLPVQPQTNVNKAMCIFRRSTIMATPTTITADLTKTVDTPVSPISPLYILSSCFVSLLLQTTAVQPACHLALFFKLMVCNKPGPSTAQVRKTHLPCSGCCPNFFLSKQSAMAGMWKANRQ
jgi:hypothetical protein